MSGIVGYFIPGIVLALSIARRDHPSHDNAAKDSSRFSRGTRVKTGMSGVFD